MVAARINQMQSFMALMQMVIMPMFFLSGALFPVANLPTWLAILNRLDPLTYAVEPMRAAIFSHLDISEAGAQRARPGRHVVGLARSERSRGRGDRATRPGDAVGCDMGVLAGGVAAAPASPRGARSSVRACAATPSRAS